MCARIETVVMELATVRELARRRRSRDRRSGSKAGAPATVVDIECYGREFEVESRESSSWEAHEAPFDLIFLGSDLSVSSSDGRCRCKARQSSGAGQRPVADSRPPAMPWWSEVGRLCV